MYVKLTETCTQSSCIRQYHFVNESKSWTEAQRYCRHNYTDLATIDNMEEMNRLYKAVRRTYGKAWIGLYDDLNSWRWSLDNTALQGGFKSWYVQQQVNSYGQSLCVYMSNYRGTWSEAFCYNTFPFVCYDGENLFRFLEWCIYNTKTYHLNMYIPHRKSECYYKLCVCSSIQQLDWSSELLQRTSHRPRQYQEWGWKLQTSDIF